MKKQNQFSNAERFSKTLAVKICGMMEAQNILEIVSLSPSYLGFIFAEKSPRYFEGIIPKIAADIKKVGVFVGASIEIIVEMVNLHQLQAVQLHGNESVEFCKKLKEELHEDIEIFKVFSISNEFDFAVLKDFEEYCDYFLLDTKGKLPGGNGTQFDWKILDNNQSQKPFFLSGGIGLQDLEAINKLLINKLPLFGIDCNSKLELSPGIKDVEKCRTFLQNFKKE